MLGLGHPDSHCARSLSRANTTVFNKSCCILNILLANSVGLVICFSSNFKFIKQWLFGKDS